MIFKARKAMETFGTLRSILLFFMDISQQVIAPYNIFSLSYSLNRLAEQLLWIASTVSKWQKLPNKFGGERAYIKTKKCVNHENVTHLAQMALLPQNSHNSCNKNKCNNDCFQIKLTILTPSQVVSGIRGISHNRQTAEWKRSWADGRTIGGMDFIFSCHHKVGSLGDLVTM